MLNAVVCSDFHLDCFNTPRLSPFFVDRKDIDYQISEIEKPFAYAVENCVDNVFVLGDLGDNSAISSVAMSKFLALLIKYDGILNIHMIPGNHDTNSDSNSLNIVRVLSKKFETVHFYTEPTLVEVDGIRCNFVPFPYTDFVDKSINFCHTDIQGSYRDNGHAVKGLAAGNSHVVSGHIHKYQSFGKVLYCGSLYQTDFGNTLPKGFVHIRSNQKEVRHKFINSSPRYCLKTLKIEKESDFKLEKDPHILYKLDIDPYVECPDLNSFDNIVSVYSDTAIDVVQVDMQTDVGLVAFLKECGLTRVQRNRAKELVKLAGEMR